MLTSLTRKTAGCTEYNLIYMYTSVYLYCDNSVVAQHTRRRRLSTIACEKAESSLNLAGVVPTVRILRAHARQLALPRCNPGLGRFPGPALPWPALGHLRLASPRFLAVSAPLLGCRLQHERRRVSPRASASGFRPSTSPSPTCRPTTTPTYLYCPTWRNREHAVFG